MDLLTIEEAANILQVSSATIRNWIKLEKIQYVSYQGSKRKLLDKEYVQNLKKELMQKEGTKLKSRRNKTQISGNLFYDSYIDGCQEQQNTIKELLNIINQKKIMLYPQQLNYLLANYAIALFISKENINCDTSSYLKSFLLGNLKLGKFELYILDLIDDNNSALQFIQLYEDLFNKYLEYDPSQDILGLLYISCKNLNDRKENGMYYTPNTIAQELLCNISFKKNKKILDPCCGTGNFLLQLPKNIILEDIYANDIDETSVKITRINMFFKYNCTIPMDIMKKHIQIKDFIIDNFNQKYDYIIGNPPWGGDLSKYNIDYLKTLYSSVQSKEICNLFIEKSLEIIKNNGIISFILPESILNVKIHKKIRQIIMNNGKIQFLEYLGDIFKGVNCPSIIFQIQKDKNDFSTIDMKVKNKTNSYIIENNRKISPDYFNFQLNNEEYKIIEKVYSYNNQFLKNQSQFSLGIVTGDNKKYVKSSKIDDSYEIILKGKNLRKYRFIGPYSYIKFDPNLYQQVAAIDTYRCNEKLLYKFISNKLVFAYDSGKTLSLNSCNILIPKIPNYSIKYILAILNSSLSQFIFEKKFMSVKVLKSHIEQIPIPECSVDIQENVVKLVDALLDEDIDDAYFNELYNKIDDIIFDLYSLNIEERTLIQNSNL